MVQLKQRIVLGEPLQPQAVWVVRNEPPTKKQRCEIHKEEARTKKEKDNAPKSKTLCDKCKKTVCGTHSKIICTVCLAE